jgi:hypothetical protein
MERTITVRELAPDRFQVTVKDARSSSNHTVRVSADDLGRWGRGEDGEALIRRSFDFLLEREPKESILKEFELSVIQRYFPEFDRAIRGVTS